jgi:hypothetical protein
MQTCLLFQAAATEAPVESLANAVHSTATPRGHQMSRLQSEEGERRTYGVFLEGGFLSFWKLSGEQRLRSREISSRKTERKDGAPTSPGRSKGAVRVDGPRDIQRMRGARYPSKGVLLPSKTADSERGGAKMTLYADTDLSSFRWKVKR